MLKQPATYSQQIAKLRAHGCSVTDVAACEEILSRISYYRLSAYFLTFKQPDGTFISGTSFNDVYRLYEFDSKLRSLLFPVIEELEVYLRSQFSYYHTHKYGADGYMNPSNYNFHHNHADFVSRINGLIRKNNKIPFVSHHIKKYSSQFPLWAIIELYSFGMLSYFYAEMLTADQKALAKTTFHTSVSNVKSWLYCCTNLRNICAHSRRLYNGVFSAIPANIPHVNKSTERKLFAAIMALRELYPSADKWNNSFIPAMSALIGEHTDVVDLRHIGFPADWDTVMLK